MLVVSSVLWSVCLFGLQNRALLVSRDDPGLPGVAIKEGGGYMGVTPSFQISQLENMAPLSAIKEKRKEGRETEKEKVELEKRKEKIKARKREGAK